MAALLAMVMTTNAVYTFSNNMTEAEATDAGSTLYVNAGTYIYVEGMATPT